jgi:hypothetical protein
MKKILIAAMIVAATPAVANNGDLTQAAIMALRVAVACPQLNLNLDKVVGILEKSRVQEHLTHEQAAAIAKKKVDAWQRHAMAKGNFCQAQSESLVASGFINDLR